MAGASWRSSSSQPPLPSNNLPGPLPSRRCPYRGMGQPKGQSRAPSPTMDPDLLTAEQIGKLLGFSYKTILEWRKQGLIPAEISRGRTILFSEEKVREALRKDAERQLQSR